MRELTKQYINELTFKIIGAAIEVHKQLGPGLIESVYESCLEFELISQGFKVTRQQTVPIFYKGNKLDALLRYDLLVEDCIIVELKAVTEMHPVFDAVTMAYMRLLQKPKGILINFCCQNIFHDGQKTFVNEIYRDLPDF